MENDPLWIFLHPTKKKDKHYGVSIGTKLEWQHLDWLRPGDGLPPGEEEKLLAVSIAAEKILGTGTQRIGTPPIILTGD